jgi:hypothetical protein
MLRNRHRVASLLACIVALGFTGQVFGQQQGTAGAVLNFNQAITLGTVHVANGYIDLTSGALICTTSSFGYVPTGSEGGGASSGQEIGATGVAEYGANAITDACLEGEYNSTGYQNGPSGIVSSTAANAQGAASGQTTVGYGDNSLLQYNTWRGVALDLLPSAGGGGAGNGNNNVSMMSYDYVGDLFLGGNVGSADVSTILFSIRHPHTSADGTGVVKWVDGAVLGDSNTSVTSADLSATLAIIRANLPDLGFNPMVTAAPSAGSAVAVPEPGTFALLAVFASILILLSVTQSYRLRCFSSSVESTMSRVKYFGKFAGLAALIVLFASAVAQANIYLDITGAPLSGSASVQSVNISSSNMDPTLYVYAFIIDSAPSNTASGDTFSAMTASFHTTGAALKGDVSWGSFNAPPLYANANGSQAGTNYAYAGNSTQGLGGTSSTDTSLPDWWNPVVQSNGGIFSGGTYINASGGTLSSAAGAAGVEYYLGTINVNFAPYQSAWSGLSGSTTSSLATVAQKGTTSNKPYKWIESDFSTGQAQGNSTLVGVNGTGNLSYLPTNFVFTSSTTGTYYAGRADISAGPTATPPIYSGIPSTIAATLTNTVATGTGTQDTVDWSVGGASLHGTVSPLVLTGTSLAVGASAPLSYAYTAASTYFGSDTITVTPSGLGDNGTGAAGTTGPQSVTVNVIGLSGPKPTGDGLGTPGGPYSTPLTTSIATGGNLGGLMTALSNTTNFGIGSTAAVILAGSNGTGGPITITEDWRSRSGGELPANSHSLTGLLPLYSDVVNITGLGGTGGTQSTFALQMWYDPAQLGGTGPAAIAASNGFLYLGYRSTVDGKWHNAVSTALADGNVGVGGSAVTDFLGSWSAFTAANGTNLAALLGSWGVDTAHDTVWAVIDHDAEFAAVPEPGTLALLAAGALALGVAYRRRKVNVAQAS